MIIVFGPLLGQIPIKLLQLFVGVLLLLFGMRWRRKAILRAAGVIKLHDEQAAFDAETAQLRATSVKAASSLDPLAVATAFKAVLLEGIEVEFIVIAVCATANMIVPARVGDRKGVGKGKVVRVREIHGGRRLVKKTKKKH